VKSSIFWDIMPRTQASHPRGQNCSLYVVVIQFFRNYIVWNT
jgi:hypothetical protein